ncbi:MAG: GTP cyclohydrolase IIa [Nitrososphaerales archaeon]
MVQISIVRIDGYGQWTLTKGTDREHKLQILQSKLYSDMQKLFSQKNGLAFFNRFDEVFAVTNGLTVEEHIEILQELLKLYALDISISIGNGSTPYAAHLDACRARESNIINNNNNIKFKVYGSTKKIDYVQIMHVDVDGSTSNISAKLTPYEISSLIATLHAKLAHKFMEKDALTFFLGGDNFMVIANGVDKAETVTILDEVAKGMNIKLKCGIGKARTAREAAEMATKALDKIRDMRRKGKADQVFEISCL